ncbi:MAG TPA: hypothetical protein VI815_03830 [Candidatus Nanoarchaeia archaeon]|nr:hypothetical protein [Candidatus Nanoarchaeia archaeon]
MHSNIKNIKNIKNITKKTKKNTGNKSSKKISLNKLKKEHGEIEHELQELEVILEDREFNHSNFLHVFKKVCDLWDSHETKEKYFFENLNSEKMGISVKTLHFNNPELRGHKKVLQEAIKSGSEFELKVALDTDGRMLIDKLRRDMKNDDDLYDKAMR